MRAKGQSGVPTAQAATSPPVEPAEPEAGRPGGGPRNKPSLRVRALALLARREHSRLELETKLAGDQTDPNELARLLDEFERRGWLSERRLAEQQVARARGRYGPKRVLHDLRAKGVEGAALGEVAAQLKAGEVENARAVWRKRFGRPPTDLKERARQARFLAGRGFSSEVIRQVLAGETEES
jgi:regulatory protein